MSVAKYSKNKTDDWRYLKDTTGTNNVNKLSKCFKRQKVSCLQKNKRKSKITKKIISITSRSLGNCHYNNRGQT